MTVAPKSIVYSYLKMYKCYVVVEVVRNSDFNSALKKCNS